MKWAAARGLSSSREQAAGPVQRIKFQGTCACGRQARQPRAPLVASARTQHVDQAAQQEAVASQQRAPQPVEEAGPAQWPRLGRSLVGDPPLGHRPPRAQPAAQSHGTCGRAAGPRARHGARPRGSLARAGHSMECAVAPSRGAQVPAPPVVADTKLLREVQREEARQGEVLQGRRSACRRAGQRRRRERLQLAHVWHGSRSPRSVAAECLLVQRKGQRCNSRCSSPGL